LHQNSIYLTTSRRAGGLAVRAHPGALGPPAPGPAKPATRYATLPFAWGRDATRGRKWLYQGPDAARPGMRGYHT